MSLFDELRAALRDLLEGRTAPSDRASSVRAMTRALVQARVALGDLHDGARQTAARLAAERRELETVRRRRDAAEAIRDAETVEIADRFAAHHAERVAVLEAKLAAQNAEIELAERELGEMTMQLRAAAKGVGVAPPRRPTSDAEVGLPDDTPLRRELDDLSRTAELAARERAAADALAELKKKMGR